MAYVDKVTNYGPAIKAKDAKALKSYAILAASCKNTLKAIGLLQRLPPKLQASWRDNADRIHDTEGIDICIDDVVV